MEGDNFFFNQKRVKQVMTLAPRLRVAGLDPYDYAVLLELARRMAHETLPAKLAVTDTCFPTMEQIAAGSVCKVRRVGTAIANLKRHGFIAVSKWEDRRGVKHNRYQVTAVWDTAFAPTEKSEGNHIPSAPVLSEADRAADRVFLEAIDSKPVVEGPKPIPAAEDKYEHTDAIVAHLRSHFGDHATFQRPDATRIMARCVRDCIDIVGTHCSSLDAFKWIFDDEKIRIATAKSDFLGGFIRGAFRDWSNDYMASLEADYLTALNKICLSDEPKLSFSSTLDTLKPACSWLRDRLKTDLLELVIDDAIIAGTEDEHWVTLRVTDEYKAARRLALSQEAGSEATSTYDFHN